MLDETINVYLQTIFVTSRSMLPSPPTVGLQEAVNMVVLMRHMIAYGPANSNTNWCVDAAYDSLWVCKQVIDAAYDYWACKQQFKLMRWCGIWFSLGLQTAVQIYVLMRHMILFYGLANSSTNWRTDAAYDHWATRQQLTLSVPSPLLFADESLLLISILLYFQP